MNRDSFAKLGAQLAVPCESDDGFFDLYRGAEFVHTVRALPGRLRALSVPYRFSYENPFCTGLLYTGAQGA